MSDYTRIQRDGYSVKVRSGGRPTGKLPFFCPYEGCGRATDTIDDRYLKAYGVCAQCYITLIEDRKTPLIDVEEYRKRLEDRGF